MPIALLVHTRHQMQVTQTQQQPHAPKMMTALLKVRFARQTAGEKLTPHTLVIPTKQPQRLWKLFTQLLHAPPLMLAKLTPMLQLPKMNITQSTFHAVPPSSLPVSPLLP